MLESGATRLRLLREEDMPALAACLAAGATGPYYPGDFESVQELKTRFATDGFWSERDGRLLIENLEGRMVGWIFHFRNHPFMDSRELAYFVFDPAMRNRGHATAALRLLTSHLFNTLPVHRLELTIATENESSLRVAEKVGYRREGILRQAWYSPALGRRLDGCRYALLRGE
ncbi:MAG TPA: GNAT family protein [Rectinemataceae bacterium]|nr:GNAT family protein [Rectinemataceae bacterium]